VQVGSFQTNSEAAMCERIHRAFEEGQDAILINAGAWTHYSYGIRDALAILVCPVVAEIDTKREVEGFIQLSPQRTLLIDCKDASNRRKRQRPKLFRSVREG
jgi:hypothetical protein